MSQGYSYSYATNPAAAWAAYYASQGYTYTPTAVTSAGPTAPTTYAYGATTGTYPVQAGATAGAATQQTAAYAYPSSYNVAAQPQAQPAAPAGPTQAAAPYAYPAYATSATPAAVAPRSTGTTGGTSYSHYDAAVYAAATSYLQSKATGQGSNWFQMQRGGGHAPSAGSGGTATGGGGGGYSIPSTSGRGGSGSSYSQSYKGGGGGGYGGGGSTGTTGQNNTAVEGTYNKFNNAAGQGRGGGRGGGGGGYGNRGRGGRGRGRGGQGHQGQGQGHQGYGNYQQTQELMSMNYHQQMMNTSSMAPPVSLLNQMAENEVIAKPPKPPNHVAYRQDGFNERHLMVRHQEIQPQPEHLASIQRIVTDTEKALKTISDKFAKEEEKKLMEQKKAEGVDVDIESLETPERLLKCVLRVGPLANGLLIGSDMTVSVIVVCSEKPTIGLLNRIVEELPKSFEEWLCHDRYTVEGKPAESAVFVNAAYGLKISLAVILTSALFREDGSQGEGDLFAAVSKPPDPPDVLPKQKCLEALSAVRQAKYFQNRCANWPAAMNLLRLMRDLCYRVPTWTPLSDWALELLVEKMLNTGTGPEPMNPTDGFRKVFEAVSAGVLLEDGPGLVDPCEKGVVDAIGYMTRQQREDITASAQHALRLLCFRQIYKVLSMEKLMPDNPFPGPPPHLRKRQWVEDDLKPGELPGLVRFTPSQNGDSKEGSAEPEQKRVLNDDENEEKGPPDFTDERIGSWGKGKQGMDFTDQNFSENADSENAKHTSEDTEMGEGGDA